jgi:hypothetical protein
MASEVERTIITMTGLAAAAGSHANLYRELPRFLDDAGWLAATAIIAPRPIT